MVIYRYRTKEQRSVGSSPKKNTINSASLGTQGRRRHNSSSKPSTDDKGYDDEEGTEYLVYNANQQISSDEDWDSDYEMRQRRIEVCIYILLLSY